MEIEGTTFGAITIDGKTYEHDVIIRLSGEVLTEEEALEEVLWHLACPVEGRSEVRLREGMRAAHLRLGPDGQRASIARS